MKYLRLLLDRSFKYQRGQREHARLWTLQQCSGRYAERTFSFDANHSRPLRQMGIGKILPTQQTPRYRRSCPMAAILTASIWTCRWNEGIHSPMDRTGIEILHHSSYSDIVRIRCDRDRFWRHFTFVDRRRRFRSRSIPLVGNRPLRGLLGHQKVSRQSIVEECFTRFTVRCLFCRRYSWSWAISFGLLLARKINALKLILQVTFCNPPGHKWNSSDSIRIQPIR